jgi:hypothetical protein
MAGTANLQNANVAVVAAQHVKGDNIRTLFLIGGRIEGDVHTTFDTRQTLLAGLIGGLVTGLIFAMTRTLRRR